MSEVLYIYYWDKRTPELQKQEVQSISFFIDGTFKAVVYPPSGITARECCSKDGWRLSAVAALQTAKELFSKNIKAMEENREVIEQGILAAELLRKQVEEELLKLKVGHE